MCKTGFLLQYSSKSAPPILIYQHNAFVFLEHLGTIFNHQQQRMVAWTRG